VHRRPSKKEKGLGGTALGVFGLAAAMLTMNQFLLGAILCIVGLGFLVAGLWQLVSGMLHPHSTMKQAAGIAFCLLLVTVAVLACVSFIGNRRHEFIANKEAQAAEIERQYVPDVVVEYGSKRFWVYNTGKTSIYLWGVKLSTGQKSLENEPRIIPPLAHYWLAADQVEEEILGKVASGTDRRSLMWFYLENERGERYIAKVRLWIVVTGRSVAINTQMVSLRMGQW
jgi:hypothetical protein